MSGLKLNGNGVDDDEDGMALLNGDGVDDLEAVHGLKALDGIPDHLLPAAHDQGPLSMDNGNGNRKQQIFSRLPPRLITADSVRERKRVRMERERMMEEQRQIQFAMAAQEEQQRAIEEEAAKLKGGGGG